MQSTRPGWKTKRPLCNLSPSQGFSLSPAVVAHGGEAEGDSGDAALAAPPTAPTLGRVSPVPCSPRARWWRDSRTKSRQAAVTTLRQTWIQALLLSVPLPRRRPFAYRARVHRL